jgi:hypothetical protein
MTTSQAINAYNSLFAVLITEPTEAKEEREANRKRFIKAFQNILIDAGYPVDSPMRVGSGKNDPCKT